MTEPVAVVVLTTWPKRAAFLRDALRAYDALDWPGKRLVLSYDGEPLAPARADVACVRVPAALRGEGPKRNAGLAEAGGLGVAWAAFLDDDDLVLPGHLRLLCAARDGRPVVRTSNAWVADAGFRVAAMRGHCYASSLVHVPSFLRTGGYVDVPYATDVHFFTARMPGAAVAPGATYVYRRHGGNASSGKAADEAWSEEAMVRDLLEDQRRWPDPAVSEAQRAVDAVLARPDPRLVVPA